ncbi:MAG: hypothetical protein HYX47_16940 [Burkholderiales bacterium]|nr:hypothetical protein [Burkholderiales bacterium]
MAQADSRTHVVEFTVPRDPLKRLKLNMPGDIKLRGWYVEGAGVEDGRGGRTRALVIMDRAESLEGAAVQGRSSLPRAPAWSNIKELVATTPDVWEMSSRPK